MSIEFVIRTKLDNKGIVRAENELRALFEQGEALRSQSVTGRGAGLGSVSPLDSDKLEEGNQALKTTITLLKQAGEAAKAAGRAALSEGDISKASGFQKVAAGYEKQINLLKRLQPEQKKVSANQQIINNNAEAFRGAKSVKDYERALKRVSATLKEQAKLQLEAGNIGGLEGTQRARRGVESFRGSLKSLGEQQQDNSRITSVMNSKFNAFGFSLFITISTIKQLIAALQAMFNVSLEGAQMADRIQSFSFALERAGISATKMRRDLKEASQGLVSMDTAMKGTIQLLKSGLPEAATSSDELLKIATNAAIVSGEVDKADEIFQKLIRGIVRASPRLIDDADILLKLGDAYGEYAAQMGIVGRELTVVEQKMATLNAVVKEGKRIEELAEGFESIAQPLQELKTDFIEAANVIKVFFGTIASSAAEAGVDDSLKGSGFVDFLDFLEIETGATTEELSQMFSSFAARLAGSLSVVVAALGAFAEILIQTFTTGKEFVLGFIGVVSALADFSKGAVTAEEATDRIWESFNKASQEADNLKESIDTQGHVNDRFANSMEKLGFSVKQTTDDMGKLTLSIEELRRAEEQAQLGKSLNRMEEALESAIEARTGIEAQRGKRISDAREDLADKLVDIEEKLGDRLEDINESYHEKLLSISENFKEKATQIAEATAEKLADIEEDLAEKLSDVSEKASEGRGAALDDKNKAIEDISEAHQKKLADIEKKWQLDRMKALIDRDARALFEAQQARKDDVDDANQDAVDKREDAEEQLTEKIEKINELEKKQRQDAIENAAERRRDTLKAQAKQLADLIKSNKKQKEAAKKAQKEQREDAIESARDQRADAKESFRDRMDDIREWYSDQLAAQREANMREKIEELRHLQEMGELTQDHLNELSRMNEEYERGLGNGSGGDGDINYNSPGGGGNGSSPPIEILPGVVQQLRNAPSPTGQNATNQSQTVNVNVTNDETLKEIFKAISYEATMEIVQ